MSPSKILHELVQNLYVWKQKIKFSEISKVTFTVSRPVLAQKIISKFLYKLSSIFRTPIPILLLLNYTSSDIPICRQHYVPDS